MCEKVELHRVLQAHSQWGPPILLQSTALSLFPGCCPFQSLPTAPQSFPPQYGFCDVRFHLDIICNTDARVLAALRAAVWLLSLSVGGCSLKLDVCKCYCIRVQVQPGTSQTLSLTRVYGGNYHSFSSGGLWCLIWSWLCFYVSWTWSEFKLFLLHKKYS